MERIPETRVPENNLRPNEKPLVRNMVSEAMSSIMATGRTTADQDFVDCQMGIVNSVLRMHGIQEEERRAKFWGIMMAATGKMSSPESIQSYKEKQRMKGKKYLPLERPNLTRIIEDALERVCISTENADFNSKEEKEKRRIRKNINNSLTSALNSYNVKPEEHQKYIKDLRPIILSAIKNPLENPPRKHPEGTLSKIIRRKPPESAGRHPGGFFYKNDGTVYCIIVLEKLPTASYKKAGPS